MALPITLPHIARSVVVGIVIVLIIMCITVCVVPYNQDLTGMWEYNNVLVWLSRSPGGNYLIHDVDKTMVHIGTLKVDRLLNLDRYNICNPTGSLADICAPRIGVSTINSQIEMFNTNNNQQIMVKV